MSSSESRPALLGVCPGVGDEVERVTVRDSGRWRPGEHRSARCPGGYVAVVGACLVDDARMRADLATAVRDDRPELVASWPGSYLAVLVRDREVTAFVDLAGQHPLYYAGTPVVFGTSPRQVAEAARLARRPDPVVAATDVFCAAVPALTRNLTPITGLRKVEGGQALRVSRTGEVTLWSYARREPDESFTAEECAAALRDALDAAVAARMSSGAAVSADFSGGLDSTSVAFLAARHRTEPLTAFTYHHPDAPADDLVHARRNAALAHGLRHEVVRGTADTLTYRDLDPHPADELPDFAAAVRSRNRLRLRHVASAGATVHLGGEGADALVVAPPSYLGDLARTGQVERLLADSRSWARLRNDSPARVVRRAVRLSATSRRRALHDLARRLHRGEARRPTWVDAISWWPGPGPEARWLTPGARSLLADAVHEHAARCADAFDGGVADYTARHDLERSGAVQHRLSEIARSYGVWPQAPFLDNDVIRACTRLPAHRRAVGAEFKPLLRNALRGRVPETVFLRRGKGNYLAEDYRGVRAAAPELKTLLRSSRLADLGVVEPRSVVDSVEDAAAGAGTPFPALNRLLAYEVWLGATS
ncbi:lasso peptide isopeptide bond-forming cyclase [Saccharothrix mutabilis subsp. mutabilis]|uniref:asparagine synthase (glutamine-hydrolyzing) n=1 Tax=Saccharothrix mutabilis subsp. mutabilis TaxID=66855 RepID=A0ABN0U707_9PSEU